MSITYQEFLKTNIDLSLLGVIQSEESQPYFCTPKDASTFGRAGVDGIHFCFIPGFGEMVFAVSPMNLPGEYVHPLAADFTDFLRLLLACGDTAALEQAWQWTAQQFDTFLHEYSLSDAQQKICAIIRQETGLLPIEKPYEYIRKLQTEFDYSRIEYTEDLSENLSESKSAAAFPEWKVYFNGSFWGPSGGEHAGTELSIGKVFQWENEVWQIPSIYLCSPGLVIDYLHSVPKSQIQAFLDKWNLTSDCDEARFSSEQLQLLEQDNPLAIDLNTSVIFNGTALNTSHGCGTSWNPCFPTEQDTETQGILQHYNLDPDCGWVILRQCYPWKTKRKPKIKTLSACLSKRPASIPGGRFSVQGTGDTFSFTHPITGQIHELTVQEYTQDTISDFPSNGLIYPKHCIKMTYTLSPDLENKALQISDCAPSDQPQFEMLANNKEDSLHGAASIGIIGGADGPTSILLFSREEPHRHTAFSALHFEPVSTVQWRMTFHEKLQDDCTVKLI